MLVPSGYRQIHVERGATTGRAGNRDKTLGVGDGAMHHREAQTNASARLLGGEERLEGRVTVSASMPIPVSTLVAACSPPAVRERIKADPDFIAWAD